MGEWQGVAKKGEIKFSAVYFGYSLSSKMKYFRLFWEGLQVSLVVLFNKFTNFSFKF